MNFSLWTKKPPEPMVRLEHLDDERDDGFRCEILAALFPLREGELAEEVFVNVAEDVLGVQVGVLEGDGGDEIDEADQAFCRKTQLGVAPFQDALQLFVFLFNLA